MSRQKNNKYRLWASQIAMIALVIQVLMPLGQAMAANAANDSGGIYGNTLEVCTQLGIRLQVIQPNGEPMEMPTSSAVWDCPVCQLQISGHDPAPKVTVNIPTVPEYKLAFGAELDRPKYTGLAEPNPARAPPA